MRKETQWQRESRLAVEMMLFVALCMWGFYLLIVAREAGLL